jgi:hypothetical protein
MKERIRVALAVVAGWFVLEELTELIPRLNGSYFRHLVITPVVAALWFALSPRARAKVSEYLAEKHYPMHPGVRVVLTSVGTSVLAVLVIAILLNIPFPQPPGHGVVLGSLPKKPPMTFHFPIPDKLPPPETVETKRPTEKPPAPNQPLPEIEIQSTEDLIAQLPVIGITEFAAAPYQTPEPIPPAQSVVALLPIQPTNLRVIP